MALNLGNPGVTHSVLTAFIIDECSGNGMGHVWVTEDVDECSGNGMGHVWVTEDVDECSGNGMGHAWVTEDVNNDSIVQRK